VVPFDLFPQTRHIETVATLSWPEIDETPTPVIPEGLEALFLDTGKKKKPGRYSKAKRNKRR